MALFRPFLQSMFSVRTQSRSSSAFASRPRRSRGLPRAERAPCCRDGHQASAAEQVLERAPHQPPCRCSGHPGSCVRQAQ
jgi:hypothetical protein